MPGKKETALTPAVLGRDPFAMLRQMTSELDRVFDEPLFGRFRFPLPSAAQGEWNPGIDVLERDGRLVTKVDLPGVKKEDVKVEVTDGHLAISGERKSEVEETKDQLYRRERQYGSFYRMVPLPEGVKVDDVKATFADGVLEVSVPLPTRQESKARTIEIQEPAKASKPAA